MSAKIITKGELLKLIKENTDITPYGGEQAEQYTDNESFNKLLYSHVYSVDIEWSKMDDDLNHAGRFEIDWGIHFEFNNNRLKIQPFVKSVKGTIRLYKYQNGNELKKDYPFDSKGYQMNLTLDDITDAKDEIAITSIEINIDTKTIKFRNYGMNPDYNAEKEWNT